MRPPEPSERDKVPRRSAPRCPNCGSEKGRVISLFGTQAMTLQYRCPDCGDLYEAIKYSEDEG